MSNRPVAIVVCGVSGCGKSTVAQALATRLGCPFEEGDDYHSEANKAKMHAGIPLDDADRKPWLDDLHTRAVVQHLNKGESVVLSCSALKRQYRDALRGQPVATALFFVQVAANQAVIEKRLKARTGHFMASSLLASQIAIFEPLDLTTERGVVVDPALSIDAIVDTVMAALLHSTHHSHSTASL